MPMAPKSTHSHVGAIACIFADLQVLFRALGFSEALIGGASCESKKNTSKPIAFEVSSKRRKGFPSETHVKRGSRVLGGNKELIEKLGRNDPKPVRIRPQVVKTQPAHWWDP